jgi:hypothetical protein
MYKDLHSQAIDKKKSADCCPHSDFTAASFYSDLKKEWEKEQSRKIDPSSITDSGSRKNLSTVVPHS